MPALKDIQDKVIGQVNGLTAALKLTKQDLVVDEGGFTVNPINLLVTLFKSLKGYDWLVDKISQFIVYVLPGLEWSMKSVLLSNLEAMVSCSINPVITKKLILEGTVFDVKKIDILNIFNYSPLDTGRQLSKYDIRHNNYYFGCTKEDGIEYIDDLKDSRDFNAVLWYCRNTPDERVVWRREKDLGEEMKLDYKTVGGSTQLSWYKQVKSNGIVTIEYTRDSNSLRDSEGRPMPIQEPMEDCMHVFIGCNTPLYASNIEQAKAEIESKTVNIAAYDALLEELEAIKRETTTRCLDEVEKLQNQVPSERHGIPLYGMYDIDAENKLTALGRKDTAVANLIADKIKKASKNTTLADELSDCMQTDADGSLVYFFELAGDNGTEFRISQELASTTRKREIADKVIAQDSVYSVNGEYPSATSNYYYLHPLVEFNTDFVLSMQLFDAKVVASQLIEALTGMYSLSEGFGRITVQTRFIQAQIRELVEKIITTDVAVVNDCFFSFTNDSYNNLLQQAELARVNLFSLGGNTAQSVPSASEVMDSLNSLSPDATKEEVQSAIAGSIFKAVSSCNPHGPSEIVTSAELNVEVLTDIMMKLVYVIVTAIISPKIYILLMMNMKIMEEDVSFDIQKFIAQFKDMVVAVIQSVKNEIMDWFISELNAIVKEIAMQLSTKLILEQYQYYVDLFTRCIECLKLHRHEYDWAMDDVNYADITEMAEYSGEEC